MTAQQAIKKRLSALFMSMDGRYAGIAWSIPGVNPAA